MHASAVSFDTYEYIKEFKKAGVPEAQAVLFVKTLKDSRDYDLSKLATQEQIGLFKQETKNNIEKLDQKIEYLRKESKTDTDRVEQKIESSKNEYKADLELFKHEVKSDFDRLEQKIEHNIKESELRLLNRLGVIIFLSITGGPAIISWISRLVEMVGK